MLIINILRALNFVKCSETTKKKIEFNLATLYTHLQKLEKAKSYLDGLKQKSIAFVKNQDIALLYTHLASSFNENKLKIECYKLAGEHFCKSKDWYKYCQVTIMHAHFLNEMNLFKESYLLADSVLRACFHLENHKELGKKNNSIYLKNFFLYINISF